MSLRPQIAFCLDQGFIYPTSVAMYSLYKNTKSIVDVHVFGYNFTDDNWEKFHKIAAFFGQKIIAHPLGDNDISLPKTHLRKHISGASFARLYLPKFLSGKIIYLDGDILVRHDIQDMWGLPLMGKIAGVCTDSYSMVSKFRVDAHESGNVKMSSGRLRKHQGRLDKLYRIFPTDDLRSYFNAGILYLDIDRLGAFPEISNQFCSAELAYEIGGGSDQMFLNKILKDQTILLPLKWNAQGATVLNVDDVAPVDQKNEWREARLDPAIFHYSTGDKPWLPFYKTLSWSRRHRILEYRKYMREIKRNLSIGQ